MSGLVGDLARWSVEVVHTFGYLGLAVLMALTNMSIPIPSEVVLPLTGFLVSEGRFSIFLVLLAAMTGATIGALVFYGLGRLVGEERLRRFVGRFGRFVFVAESDLDKAGRWFERHGGEAIIICHLIPGLGGYISIPAGIERMPILKRFVPYTILGTTLWNVTFVGLGWALGTQWVLVQQYVSFLEYVVLAAFAGGILWFLWRRWRKRKR